MITFPAEYRISGSAGAATTFTVTNVAVAADERLVVCILVHAVSWTITSVVFNGSENLSLITSIEPTGAGSDEMWIYELTNPSVATASVVVTRTQTTNDEYQIRVVRVAGAASGSGWRSSPVTGSGTSLNPSITISTNSNNKTFTFLTHRDLTSTSTIDGDTTQLFTELTSGSGAGGCRSHLLECVHASSATPSTTLNNSEAWGAIGFDVNIPSLFQPSDCIYGGLSGNLGGKAI